MNSTTTIGKLKNGEFAYEGEIRNGMPNGKGILRWGNGESFEGMFANGMPSDGAGILMYPDGSRYKGECKDVKPNGWGKRVTPGLSEIEGEWRGGNLHGYSVMKVSDARAAQVGAPVGWTAEGIITQGVQRSWWIKTGADLNDGKPTILRAADGNFDIPQEDLPLGIKARLFLGFVEMCRELCPNERFPYGLPAMTLPIDMKAEAYYSWLLEKLNAAKSVEDYATLAKKFGEISEYRDSSVLAEKCNTHLK